MSNELIEQYREIEKNKLNVLIEKRGIDVTIDIVEDKPKSETSLDLLEDEYNIKSVADINSKPVAYKVAETIQSKVLILNNNNQDLHNWIFSDNDDFNINPSLYCYIKYDEVIKVGSILNFTDYNNIKYKVVSILKNRGLSDYPVYKIARD